MGLRGVPLSNARRGPRAGSEVAALKVSLLCNIAACALGAGDFAAVRASASEALGMDPRCVRALMRRARANLEDPAAGGAAAEGALADLRTAVAADPSHAEARAMLARVTTASRAQRARDRATFGGLFQVRALGAPPSARGDNAGACAARNGGR